MNPVELALPLAMAAFCLLPMLTSAATGGLVPFVALPPLVGLVLGVLEFVPPSSALETEIGRMGTLLLVLVAGAETRTKDAARAGEKKTGGAVRETLSAGVAFALPLLLGVVAWPTLSDKPASRDEAVAIGLCVAATALPVLAGIVASLPPSLRRVSAAALRGAAINDVLLWTATGLLLAVSETTDPAPLLERLVQAAAFIAALLLLRFIPGLVIGLAPGRKLGRGAAMATACGFLALAGSLGVQAAEAMGIHAFIGAYVAGLALPERIARELPDAILAKGAALLAALHFGRVAAAATVGADVIAAVTPALGLVVLSVATKTLAAIIVPPNSLFSVKERLSLGGLLQCKGLVELVLATLLAEKGVLSKEAYAAALILAIVSTIIAAPLARCLGGRMTSGEERVGSTIESKGNER
jgi:Kef-type K+ transport system membrane component KefB